MESKIEFEADDAELVYYIREGNDDAKEELFKKYDPLIHKEINRVKKKAFNFGVEYADLFQEAMLAFSQAVSNYNDEEDVKFITFATTCLRRRLLNFLIMLESAKNKQRITTIALDSEYDNQKKVGDQISEIISSEPLKKMITNETLSEVSKLIEERLSSNEKKALNYSLAGLSIEAIAAEMNMNNKQIYNLIHRARQKLKISNNK